MAEGEVRGGSSIVVVVVAALAGAASSLVVVFGLGMLPSKAAALPEPHRPSAAKTPENQGKIPAASGPAVPRAVASGECQGDRPLSDPVPLSDDATPPETFEQRAQFELDAQQARLTSHDQETRDASWAPAMETKLARALEGVEHLEPGTRIECRWVSCVLKTNWGSREVARANMEAALMKIGIEAPCSQHVTFPTQADGSKSYEAQVYFDCTDDRTGHASAALDEQRLK
jgi:hypothetical protein